MPIGALLSLRVVGMRGLLSSSVELSGLPGLWGAVVRVAPCSCIIQSLLATCGEPGQTLSVLSSLYFDDASITDWCSSKGAGVRTCRDSACLPVFACWAGVQALRAGQLL